MAMSRPSMNSHPFKTAYCFV